MRSPTRRKSVSQLRKGRGTRCAAVVMGLASALVMGCVRVDPRSDYERADRLVAERTGVEVAYHPDNEPMIEDKIAALLADWLTTDEGVQVALLNDRG